MKRNTVIEVKALGAGWSSAQGNRAAALRRTDTKGDNREIHVQDTWDVAAGINSGQISAQSVGRSSWRVTTPAVAPSMAAQCRAGTLERRSQAATAGCTTPHASAIRRCDPAISMALWSGVMTFENYKRNITTITNVMASPGQITFVISDISTRLKEEREALGLTQPQLAKLAGVSQGSVSHWEHGTRKNPRSLLKLAAAMNLRPEWLMHATGPKHPTDSPHQAGSVSRLVVEKRQDKWPFKTISPTDWGSMPAARQADAEDHIRMLLTKYGGVARQPEAQTAG